MQIEIWQVAIAVLAVGWLGVGLGWFIHSMVVADWGKDPDDMGYDPNERN